MGKTKLACRMAKASGRYTTFINLAREDIEGTNPEYFQGFAMTQDGKVAYENLFKGIPTVWTCEPFGGIVEKWLEDVVTGQRQLKTKQPLTIFLDEAHLIAPPGTVDLGTAIRKGEKPNVYVWLATMGRHWNVQLVWITQRPQLLASAVYRLCATRFFFKLAPEDIAYFRDMHIYLKEGKVKYEYEIA